MGKTQEQLDERAARQQAAQERARSRYAAKAAVEPPSGHASSGPREDDDKSVDSESTGE